MNNWVKPNTVLNQINLDFHYVSLHLNKDNKSWMNFLCEKIAPRTQRKPPASTQDLYDMYQYFFLIFILSLLLHQVVLTLSLKQLHVTRTNNKNELVNWIRVNVWVIIKEYVCPYSFLFFSWSMCLPPIKTMTFITSKENSAYYKKPSLIVLLDYKYILSVRTKYSWKSGFTEWERLQRLPFTY